MDPTPIELLPRHRESRSDARWTAAIKPSARFLFGTLIVALSCWILSGFVEALLAACVTAVASWPLYTRFRRRVAPRLTRGAASLVFTSIMTVFVLAPLTYAFAALVSEVDALLRAIATADKAGFQVPPWLGSVPLVGDWIAAKWQSGLARGGGLAAWAQRTDAAALLGWAQSLGQFMTRHAFIILFTILVVFFLYREGGSLATDARRLLRDVLGERAEAYVDVATRAVRASVNSVLLVGLFDGFATGIAYAISGVPRPAMWGAITGAFSLIPFLGYAVVAALTLKLAISGAATLALLSSGLGCAVLLFGDKVVRPVLARNGTHLPFVWILMGCLGGFEALGLVGLVIGPVLLSLVRELWEQRIRDIAAAATPDRRRDLGDGA